MKTIGVLLLLFLPLVALADEGYVHGENHCYYFNSPKGWVLDNVSGKNQGMPMVSYPKSSSWAKAITVVYSHNADFVPGAKTPQEKIKGQNRSGSGRLSNIRRWAGSSGTFCQNSKKHEWCKR
jgi:hypothetical protein